MARAHAFRDALAYALPNTNGRPLMDKADIAALLALGAAFFIAIGDVIHQRSAHDVTDEPVSHVALFLRLLRDGQWWLGSVVSAVTSIPDRNARSCARLGPRMPAATPEARRTSPSSDV